jgi:hypothetical protein
MSAERKLKPHLLKENGVFIFHIGIDDFSEIRMGKTFRKNGTKLGGKNRTSSIFEPLN